MPSAPDRGFSLVEVLVALAVFSLAAVAILKLSGENALVAAATEERAFAAIVAENRAVEVLSSAAPPALGESSGVETQAGRVWRWTQLVSGTAEAGLLRVEVRVSPADSAQTSGEVVVFRGAG